MTAPSGPDEWTYCQVRNNPIMAGKAIGRGT